MARLLEAYREAPHPCSYLPDQSASLDVRVALDVTAGEFAVMLALGWRRFGPSYFRPACATCVACIPTRVPVSAFRASRGQRRACRHSARLDRIVGPPRVDRERLELYARWHGHREQQRGWKPSQLDERSYAMEFAFPHPCVREVTFRDPDHGDRLVGLGIVDEVPDALSAVYFFWDPEHAPPSLGIAHVVRLIDDAATRHLAYVYLGYRVDACPSLAYKGLFQPQEALVGRPEYGEQPRWVVGSAVTPD